MYKVKNIKFLHLLLGIFFIVFLINKMHYEHTHIVDGNEIKHAHPFQSPQHTHTQSELSWSALLLSNTYVQEIPLELLTLFGIILCVLSIKPYCGYSYVDIQHLFSRPPPFFKLLSV